MIPNKNTFCIAPYQHVDIDPQGKLKICCVSDEKSNHKYNDIEEWFQSTTLKNLRSNLEAGIRDPICNWCWKHEDNGQESQRQIYNRHIGKILEEHWDKNFIKNNDLIDSIKNVSTANIKSFDLKLGNLCNLKCIMCMPTASSQLYAEAKLHPPLRKLYNDDYNNVNADYKYAEKTQFKDWCDKFLTKSIHIKFTGGEPFMNPYLLETLTSIPDHQKSKCILHFTTNLTKINREILEVFDKYKEVWISVSVEGIGAVLEYARYGHKWENLEKNLDQITGRENVHVSISHVVQAPTFNGVQELVNYFDDKALTIQPILLRSPECYQLSAIKTKYKQDFLKRFENYKGYNSKFMDAVSNFVRSNLDHDETLADQCVSRLQAFDKVRKNNFQNIIPVDYFL